MFELLFSFYVLVLLCASYALYLKMRKHSVYLKDFIPMFKLAEPKIKALFVAAFVVDVLLVVGFVHYIVVHS
jgi:hypothetical protein